jgi:hypothetical protein
MVSIVRPFTLVGKAVRTFFKADLQVRRGKRGLEVVLDETPSRGSAAKARPDPAQERDVAELARMRASLAGLLDEMPDNRSTLRHLAFIEHALGKKGLRALHKVPYDVLKRALDQFEGLVVNWSDEGLAALRSKMAVTLIEREPEGAAPPPARAEPEEAPTSTLDCGQLAHPVEMEVDNAADAEAALMAAYDAVVMPDLDFGGPGDDPPLELQGELNSPSGKALAKAARRGDDLLTPPARARETQA